MSIPTPLETSGGTHTTLAQEVAFYDALVADSDRVTYSQIGESVGGVPMWLVRIADGAAPEGNSMMVFGRQHGEEPAPREMAIRLIRDLAYTTDPDDVAYLQAHPVYVIATCNPDRTSTFNIRENLNGVDLNRDHVTLIQPESLAMHTALFDVDPTVVLDMHENALGTGRDVQLSNGNVPQAAPPLAAALVSLRDAVASHVTALSYNWNYYTTDPGLPNRLTVASAIGHAVSLLCETDSVSFTLIQRMDRAAEVSKAAIAWHASNAAYVATATANSRTAKTAQGAAAATPVLIDPDTFVSEPPFAYRITVTQEAAFANVLDLHRINRVLSDGSWRITMAQSSQPIIPILMDEVSPYRAFTALREGDSAAAKEWGPIQLSALPAPPHEVVEVQLWDGTAMHAVWSATP